MSHTPGLAPEAAGAAVAESGVSPSPAVSLSKGFFSVGIDEPHPPRPELVEGPFFRRCGRVAAVLSRVAQSEFCGPEGEKNLQDLAWLAPRACRHEAVLEQVMRLGAVLPARFGTLFSSTASLENFMRKHEDAMRRFLERVAGQEEWAVKGFLDPARAEAEWLARRRSEKPCPPGSALSLSKGSPPGLAYLQEQSLRIQVREALDDRVAEVCGHLLDELNLLASEIVPRRIMARELALSLTSASSVEPSKEMLLNWALLLPSAAVADFRGRIERANVEQNVGGLAFEVSGPWPPYSFCPALETAPAPSQVEAPAPSQVEAPAGEGAKVEERNHERRTYASQKG